MLKYIELMKHKFSWIFFAILAVIYVFFRTKSRAFKAGELSKQAEFHKHQIKIRKEVNNEKQDFQDFIKSNSGNFSERLHKTYNRE